LKTNTHNVDVRVLAREHRYQVLIGRDLLDQVGRETRREWHYRVAQNRERHHDRRPNEGVDDGRRGEGEGCGPDDHRVERVEDRRGLRNLVHALPPQVALSNMRTIAKFSVVIRRLRHEEHPATIFASQAFYGLLASVPAVTKLSALPPLAWGGLIAAAVIVSIAQLAMTYAYQALPVSRGSSLQMMLPIVTAIGGFACFGESFHLPELAGAALTLLATWRVVAAK